MLKTYILLIHSNNYVPCVVITLIAHFATHYNMHVKYF